LQSTPSEAMAQELQQRACDHLRRGNTIELARLTTSLAEQSARLPRQAAANAALALARQAVQMKAPEAQRKFSDAALFHVPKKGFYRGKMSAEEFAAVDKVLFGDEEGWSEADDLEVPDERTAMRGTVLGRSQTTPAVVEARPAQRLPIWQLMPDMKLGTWTPMPFGFSQELEAAFQSKQPTATVGVGTWNSKGVHYGVDFAKMTCLKQAAGPGKVLPLRRLDGQERQTHPNPSREHPWVARRATQTIQDDWLTDEAFTTAFAEVVGIKAADAAELFDFRYNEDWRHLKEAPESKQAMKRGGVEYHVPIGCKRFSVKVKGKYDGGDNTWMRMEDSAWAVAYHGTSQAGCGGILSDGMRVGPAQVYKDKKDARSGKQIGAGVYCTPSLKVALSYANSRGNSAKIAGRPVFIVMQCRVKPSAIKRCQDEAENGSAYWVINNPSDIRPYGVLVRPQE